MSDLRELYQTMILDHGRRPRNYRVLSQPSRVKEGFNPLCGDRLTLYLTVQDNTVSEVSFQGSGCAISMASASLMTESLKGKTYAEIEKIFQAFHAMVTQHENQDDAILGKLSVLKGVAEFPARVKCATLAWHTMMAALQNNQAPVSTE